MRPGALQCKRVENGLKTRCGVGQHVWGNCNDVGSQEHIISECLYPDRSVKVQGFPWCRDEPKDLRIEKLTQQILCKKHNEQLGAEVDWASKHSRDTLGAAFNLLTVKQKVRSRHWSVKRFETNMLLLER